MFALQRGSTPLVISLPHDGTDIPSALAQRMTDGALRRPDTDWHIARLYGFAGKLGASVLTPRYSRYVADLNRTPDNMALYPGADNTEVCPTTCFDRSPIYRHDLPTDEEIGERVAGYWWPYHHALAEELDRLQEQHGVALLFDAHSIRSVVPRFFTGELPHFNLGTADGESCSPALEKQIADVLGRAGGYTHVVNGRFKGGYITRHYGRPAIGIHAVQLELAQRSYMDEDYPFTYRESLAARIQPVLKALLVAMLEWAKPGE